MPRPVRYLSLLISAIDLPRGPAGPGPLRKCRSTRRRLLVRHRPAPGGDRGDATRRVEPTELRRLTLDRAGIRAALDRAPAEASARADDAGAVVTVPAPNGELIDFRVQQVAVMEDGLAARHPELTTYAGRAVADPTATIRLDLTPTGFHASVRGAARAAWYVDPA